VSVTESRSVQAKERNLARPSGGQVYDGKYLDRSVDTLTSLFSRREGAIRRATAAIEAKNRAQVRLVERVSEQLPYCDWNIGIDQSIHAQSPGLSPSCNPMGVLVLLVPDLR